MKKDDIERTPVPEDAIERFMLIVWSMVEAFGIDKIADVYEQVRRLGESVDRHVWETRNKVSPQRRVHMLRKRFIAVFKARYLQLTDLEYPKKITPLDAKIVNQVNRTLAGHNTDAEEYLEWMFEEFLVENRKFCPPNLKQVCSKMFIHKFLFEHGERSAARAEEERKKDEAYDTVARGRVLLREGLSVQDEKKVRVALKNYSDGSIILHELKQIIEAVESRQDGRK